MVEMVVSEQGNAIGKDYTCGTVNVLTYLHIALPTSREAFVYLLYSAHLTLCVCNTHAAAHIQLS